MQANIVSRSAVSSDSAAARRDNGRGMAAAKTASITLHRFGPFPGAPDSSPFVIKVMILLKLAGLAFDDVAGNPFKAPKKLLPYIEDEGAMVADSALIRL